MYLVGFAWTMPYALNDAQLDEYFLQELCALDQEHAFWQGVKRDKNLSSYMIRYVIMFFDYSFQRRGA